MKNTHLHVPGLHAKYKYSYISGQFFKYTNFHNEATLYDYLELRELLSSEKFVQKLKQEELGNSEPTQVVNDVNLQIEKIKNEKKEALKKAGLNMLARKGIKHVFDREIQETIDRAEGKSPFFGGQTKEEYENNAIKEMCAYRDPQAERILKAIYSYNKEVLMAVKKLKVSEDIMIDCKLRLYNEDLLRKYGQYKVEEAGKIELIEPKTYAQQLVQEMMAKKEKIEKKIQEYNEKHTDENQPEA